MKSTKAMACGLLMLLPLSASADETYSATDAFLKVGTEKLMPHRGGYWNPAEPGSGYFVDVIRRGNGDVFGFATAYTYTASGASTFLILQGNLTFATEAQRQSEGWIAKLASPLYQAADGQPFTGGYRPANVTPSGFGSGELVWSTRRTAELRVGAQVTPIRILHPDDPVTEAAGLLAGNWVVQSRIRATNGDSPSNQKYNQTVLKLAVSIPQPTWSVGGGASAIPASALAMVWQPPADALTFTVTCISGCRPTTSPPSISNANPIYQGARVWIDPVTLKAGWVANAVISGQSGADARVTQTIPTTTRAFNLYVDDDTINGLGQLFIGGDAPVPAGAYPGQELLMTRISPNGLHAPEGAVTPVY